MTRIAFFGHDAADAAVRRRVQGFRDDGLDVVGFTMRRRDDNTQVDWENVDLGRTFDGAYASVSIHLRRRQPRRRPATCWPPLT
jgi:succinoglycan biosynthesis protein ExoL